MDVKNDVTLLEKYCNAAATYYGAGGHSKAARNKCMMELHAEEAKKQGIELPTEIEAAKQGSFNGHGAV